MQVQRQPLLFILRLDCCRWLPWNDSNHFAESVGDEFLYGKGYKLHTPWVWGVATLSFQEVLSEAGRGDELAAV
eukprot:CAMPEP_0204896682 /NCGR_PEP_ID=MMETSP1397-20131031/308_1 /ASSEMBLY_ACC=CAM_ASM_000891 /TAXON_ID=49980 /ORGANISM="Climacostomum Climacostomum virens, Strain Stock W-24" /LENGTH=73 /DNA_ID=CAMNT_0052064335 /DNA_START=68 /DNA_END=289 /DNA_ORIENTATION=-